MSSDGAAIRVSNLSKCYQLYDKPGDRLKQFVFPRLQHFTGRQPERYFREFWALRDVSFEVMRGETVGVIGRNGSGKSTLLQLICGTLSPSGGSVETTGRVAALLELGAGFNPEFTGRENVYMNGALLGLTNDEVDARFDDISAFADIGEFIDQPVKTYSSGMYVRLAFAVQACVEPDILIVDEALAVGDVFFRQKCYRRLDDLREKGVAILLVSHAMSDVEQMCRRSILLEQGKCKFQGNASEAVKQYYLLEQDRKSETFVAKTRNVPARVKESSEQSKAFEWPTEDAFLDISTAVQVTNGWAKCTAFSVCDERETACVVFRQGEVMKVYYEFELLRDIEVPIGGLIIQNDKGVIVHGKHSIQYGTILPRSIRQGARVRFRHDVSLNVAVGEYTLEAGLATMNLADYEKRSALSHAGFYQKHVRLCHMPGVARFDVIMDAPNEYGQLRFYGVADLQGRCEVCVIDDAETG
jgi:lipopolysaccharide transport system ATP-binding protein